MSNLKWGRAVLAIGLAAFCIMLTSCGTGKVGVSSELPDESTDVITAASDGGDETLCRNRERRKTDQSRLGRTSAFWL